MTGPLYPNIGAIQQYIQDKIIFIIILLNYNYHCNCSEVGVKSHTFSCYVGVRKGYSSIFSKCHCIYIYNSFPLTNIVYYIGVICIGKE